MIPILVLLLILRGGTHIRITRKASTGTNHIERVENVILLYVALKDEGV